MELAFPVSQNGIERAVLTQSIIAHNLANLTTTAYKAYRAEAGTFKVPGTEIVDTIENTAQGPLKETGRQLDVAVAGDGYLILETDSRPVYTRAGNLHVDEEGNLVSQAGFALESSITIPEEASAISVAPTGEVYASLPDGTVEEIGRIQLARFRNPAGLLAIGDNAYAAGPDSGDPWEVDPGEEGAGIIKQGFLELSNVDEATEITNQIVNQRHFQVNLRAFQVMNDLLGRTIDVTG